MLDAGHLTNVQGGFISSSLSQREKSIRIKMGEWKVINTGGADLRNGLVPIAYPGPSEVLFKLLGLLIEQARELASVKDVLTGETGGKVMQPTTVLALIEQGMKVFNAIFKRVHRAIKAELRIHARLNVQHLTPEAYNEFFDEPEQQYDPKQDYEASDKGIAPVSDPTIATKAMALGQAQLLREIGTGNPGFNQDELNRRMLQAAEVPDIDKLLVPPPQPNPEQEALLKRGAEAEIEEKEASAAQKFAAAIKQIADAEAAEAGSQMGFYDQVLKLLQAEHGMEMDNAGGPGGLPGMAGQPNDAMVPPGAPGVGPEGQGQPPGAVVPPVAPAPSGMGGPPA